MEKIKVVFSKKLEVGDKTFEGEMTFDKPNMGMIIDAGEICPPTNQIGFGAAIIGAIADVPYSVLREMEPEDFMSLQVAMEPLLPKM